MGPEQLGVHEKRLEHVVKQMLSKELCSLVQSEIPNGCLQ
jgi:hypothetical protein